jgi:translocation and assembly module TamA
MGLEVPAHGVRKMPLQAPSTARWVKSHCGFPRNPTTLKTPYSLRRAMNIGPSLLAACLLAPLVGAALAQEAPAEALAQPRAAPPAAAFELDIQAPKVLRAILLRHLDLLRYRQVGDLSDLELDRLLQDAEGDARKLVATLGYFAPTIRFSRTPNATASADGMRHITLTVEPGEPTRVADVQLLFEGDVLTAPQASAQRQRVVASWSLPVGSAFTQVRWDNAKLQALRQLGAQRYPRAQLSTTLADIDPVSGKAQLQVILNSGPAYHLGELVISGLERYDATLVTRLARLQPGASYDRAELIAAQQRLTDSGFFDSAFLSLDTSADPDSAPVRMQLHEVQTQKLVLGVGVTTDSGTRFSVEHTHRKLPLIGWSAVSKIQHDRDTNSAGTELTSRPNADNWSWIAGAQLQNQHIGSFDVSSQTLRGGRRQVGDPLEQSYFLQYDRADTAASNAAATSVAEVLSANYAFTLRHLDNIPFPTRGWGIGMAFGVGSTLATQQYPYGRIHARALAYQPLGNDAGRLALRAQAGTVLARDGTSLPSTQLFLTGGDTTVRGYAYNELGITLPDGLTTAGRYMTQASVEWQRPIRRNGELTQWESTLFIDAGSVADRPAELQAKVGVGVGARWKSPVGPLQIDLAYGVAVQRLRLHLIVGFSF